MAKDLEQLGGVRGVVAGAGVAALVPLAVKGLPKLGKAISADGLGGVLKAPGEALQDATSGLGERMSAGIGGKISSKVDEAGGPSGILKDTLKSALPFGGDDDDDDGGGDDASGFGKGRRMPVQQSVDIGAPIETVYNQWTRFEDWPKFMHRVTRVTQKD